MEEARSSSVIIFKQGEALPFIAPLNDDQRLLFAEGSLGPECEAAAIIVDNFPGQTELTLLEVEHLMWKVVDKETLRDPA